MGKKEWKKIRHGIIIFVMAFFSAIPFVVYGKNIDSKETIRIGYIDYGGFIDLDENGEYTGYGVELLDKIAEYTGLKILAIVSATVIAVGFIIGNTT